MTSEVYLVPVGADRYELYAEPADHGEAAPNGYMARKLREARVRWTAAVDAARDGGPHRSGGFARWRDRILSHVAESAAEQRALWGLRKADSATLVHPSGLGQTQALDAMRALLARARRHHRRWLAVDAASFVVSGLLMLIPGPNLLAYYFAFRVLGHYFSWSGARRALEQIAWTARAEAALTELGRLASVPREARDAQVEAIAERLALPRLPRFFRRAAVPER